MDFQLVNITTYRGISSNADHFYAKIASDSDKIVESFSEGSDFSEYLCDTDLIWFPSLDEAQALVEKDNSPMPTDPKRLELLRLQAEIIHKEGTTRFNSVTDILRSVRSSHPSSVIVVLMQGNRRRFFTWLDNLSRETQDEIDSILCDVES